MAACPWNAPCRPTRPRDLIDLVRQLRAAELDPVAADYEERGEFPRELFRVLGKSGLLGLPYPEEYGGGAQPFEVYLQVLEELAASWLTVALGSSVHTLSCHPVATFGTDAQREAAACRTCWRATSSAPTRCPRRSPARMRRR